MLELKHIMHAPKDGTELLAAVIVYDKPSNRSYYRWVRTRWTSNKWYNNYHPYYFVTSEDYDWYATGAERAEFLRKSKEMFKSMGVHSL